MLYLLYLYYWGLIVYIYVVCLCISLGLLYFWWLLFLFLFIFFSTSQEIGWEERTRNEVFTVEWDVKPTAAVLASQAEAIVHSLTNMAAADSNGYLKSNYRLNINNHRTKHYTYSYIHVQTFTKTKPVSLSSPTMQPCSLVKPVDGFCCYNWT